MKYKLSKYTKFIPYDQGYVVYNTITGNKTFVYDKKIIDQLILLSKKPLNREEIDENLRDYFCVNADYDELEIIKTSINKLKDNKILHLIIVPTTQCNFRCIYCYEKKNNDLMTQEVLDLLYSSIVDYHESKGIDTLIIEWFGGEPLLFYKNIVDFTKKIKKYCDENSITTDFRMTTNGFGLTKKRAEVLLKDCEIKTYQITVDGGPNAHNKLRPLINGGPTWEQIMDNLLEMKRIPVDFNVMIRVNYNFDTLNEIEFLLKYIKENLDDYRFHIHFHTIGHWGGENDEYIEVISKEYEPFVLKSLIELCIKYKVFPKTHFSNIGFGASVCYASNPNSFVVLSDGSLGRCTMFTSKKENESNIVGDIRNGKFNINSEKLKVWTSPNEQILKNRGCFNCILFPTCFGNSCALGRLKNNIPVCPIEIEFLDELAILEYRYHTEI